MRILSILKDCVGGFCHCVVGFVEGHQGDIVLNTRQVART